MPRDENGKFLPNPNGRKKYTPVENPQKKGRKPGGKNKPKEIPNEPRKFWSSEGERQAAAKEVMRQVNERSLFTADNDELQAIANLEKQMEGPTPRQAIAHERRAQDMQRIGAAPGQGNVNIANAGKEIVFTGFALDLVSLLMILSEEEKQAFQNRIITMMKITAKEAQSYPANCVPDKKFYLSLAVKTLQFFNVKN